MAGLSGAAWTVRNVRQLEWCTNPPGGFVAEFVPREGAQLGANLWVLAPGDPMAMYHWEGDQEGFLVLAGEALLVADGEERPLRQWDYVHCPGGVAHSIVGAGDRPAVILAVGARGDDDSGAYPYSEVAARHNASAEEETEDPKVAYARFPAKSSAAFREEWLAGH